MTNQPITLTREQRNRIFVWNTILLQVSNALQASFRLNTMRNAVGGHPGTEPKHMTEFINHERDFYTITDTSMRALWDYSVVLFCNMYAYQGNGGGGFAKNSDGDLFAIRQEMQDYATNLLNVSEKDFNELKDKILHDRNKLIAHYDGNASEYSLNEEAGISVRRQPGTTLTHTELEMLKDITLHMSKYFHENLMSRIKIT